MGCCASVAAKPPRLDVPDPKRSAQQLHFPANPLSVKPLDDDAHFGYSSNQTAPPPVEEETVKEVLSETSIPKLCSQEEACTKKTQMAALRPQNIEAKTRPVGTEEVFSEVSDITEAYSLSETRSLSMATTISEKKEDDEATSKASREVGRKGKPMEHRKRQKPKDLVFRREQKENHPAKKPISSPRTNTRITERTVKKKDIARREPENVSRRRSRSPAPRTTTTLDVSKGKTSGRRGEQAPPDVNEPTVNESLENPLVSLECFIFL